MRIPSKSNIHKLVKILQNIHSNMIALLNASSKKTSPLPNDKRKYLQHWDNNLKAFPTSSFNTPNAREMACDRSARSGIFTWPIPPSLRGTLVLDKKTTVLIIIKCSHYLQCKWLSAITIVIFQFHNKGTLHQRRSTLNLGQIWI